MELNRLFALLMLCAGSVLAGAPAIACCVESTPTQNCCSNGPEPTTAQSTRIQGSSFVYGCCAEEAQTVPATPAMVARHVDFDLTRADPPLSVAFLAALISVHLAFKVTDTSTPSVLVAYQSPLYLRTGRLRL
jgi:hypothetical protein